MEHSRVKGMEKEGQKERNVKARNSLIMKTDYLSKVSFLRLMDLLCLRWQTTQCYC